MKQKRIVRVAREVHEAEGGWLGREGGRESVSQSVSQLGGR